MPDLSFTDAELDRLADLLVTRIEARLAELPKATAYTPRTLAAELGRSERSIRAAIQRGQLVAAKRGRGWLIGADAVQAWVSAPRATRSGVMARALGNGHAR